MKTHKANAGYLAIAQGVKGVAPKSVDAIDQKMANKLAGNEAWKQRSDEKLFAERGLYIPVKELKKIQKDIDNALIPPNPMGADGVMYEDIDNETIIEDIVKKKGFTIEQYWSSVSQDSHENFEDLPFNKGGTLDRYNYMADSEIIEWADENDLGDIAERDIDGNLTNRDEILTLILELGIPNTDAQGNFIEQFDDTYAHYDKGGNINSKINALKKGDVISIEFGSSFSKDNKVALKVRSRNKVRKGTIDKITFQNANKPNTVKYYAYERGDGVWGFAKGDMAISNVKIVDSYAEGGKVLTRNDIQFGMIIPDKKYSYRADKVISVTDKAVKIQSVSQSENDMGSKFGYGMKPYTYRWDGTGYKRQNQYLHSDGIYRIDSYADGGPVGLGTQWVNKATSTSDEKLFMNGGYIELLSMTEGFDKAVDTIVKNWNEWKDGPMTEREDLSLCKEDILEYISSKLQIDVEEINIYNLQPSPGITSDDEVVRFIQHNSSVIKTIISEQMSGSWSIVLKDYPGFTIYATPFWEDDKGAPIEIHDNKTGQTHSYFVEATQEQMNKIISFQNLIVWYMKFVIPEIEIQAKKLKASQTPKATNVNVGDYYDIVDLGLNEWTYDWEFVGTTASDEGKEWIDEAVNRDIDYFDTIYGNETFSWHLQDETNGDMVGDVREGTARQITKYINEELEDNQAVIFSGHHSIILVDDIYYRLPYNMAFRGAEEMKKYKLDRAGRQDYVMEGIFSDISDYDQEFPEEKYIFASTKQFDDSTQVFTAKELNEWFRDDLIREAVEWSSVHTMGAPFNKGRLLDWMNDAHDILVIVGAENEYLIYNEDSGNQDNADMWHSTYVMGYNLNEKEVRIYYKDITAVETKGFKRGGGISQRKSKLRPSVEKSKNYKKRVKNFVSKNKKRYFDGGELFIDQEYDWDEEVKYFAGDSYSKLTEQEKEDIKKELQLNYDFHKSFKKGGKTTPKYAKGDNVSCYNKGGKINRILGNHAEIKFNDGSTDYVSLSKIKK